MIATFIKTRQTRVLNTIFLLAGGALLLVLFLLCDQAQSPVIDSKLENQALVYIGDLQIPVSIADSSEEQEQGLSGTASLDAGTGKLFIFNTSGRYGFWMKDMKYSLDIVWIDQDFKIIAIDKDISPESYPKIFYPPSDVKYVLELNAGFSTEHDLSVNQLLTLSNKLSF